jgi:DNA-binding transcriptional ArsR family regulator
VDIFTVLAAPARRRILAELGEAETTVNQLVAALDLNQPAVSKHLKVLRQAGFVSCRGAGAEHFYRLEAAPFRELESWLEPYRRLWNRHLDALEQYLDEKEKTDENDKKRVPARPTRRGQHPRRR